VGDHDVEAVGGAALEDRDEDPPALLARRKRNVELRLDGTAPALAGWPSAATTPAGSSRSAAAWR